MDSWCMSGVRGGQVGGDGDVTLQKMLLYLSLSFRVPTQSVQCAPVSKTGNESEFHGLYKHKRPNQILLSNACFYKVGL